MATDPRTRHGRGVMVVVLLGIIFFALLALIVLKSPSGNRPAATESETLTVLPLRIRLRTEPNARAPVVATATNGETLTLVEDRGAWVRVKNTDDVTGWAERSNLERTAERDRRLKRYAAIRALPPLPGKVMDRTTLYAGPGIFYPLVGELRQGTDVRVFTRDHDFYAIDHEGKVAYADIETIDVHAASGATQLDVQTSSAPATATDTTASAEPPSPFPTETATTSAPPVAETPEPPPPVATPAPEADRSGVYAVVPAGGTQPEEIDRVVPRYPPMARRANVSGSVVIRGIVRRDGTIDNVEIIKDLPYGLGESAREAVQRWRFRPATYRGDPIDVYYTVTVNFRLQ